MLGVEYFLLDTRPLQQVVQLLVVERAELSATVMQRQFGVKQVEGDAGSLRVLPYSCTGGIIKGFAVGRQLGGVLFIASGLAYLQAPLVRSIVDTHHIYQFLL